MKRRVLFSLLPDCPKIMDVVIVMDSSSSVRRQNFEVMKNFAIHLVSKMNVSKDATHVSVVHYSHKVYVDWHFSDNRAQNADALKDAIKNVKYPGGGTRTDLALETTEKLKGARAGVLKVVIVITDGKTSRKSKKYKDVLKPLVVKIKHKLEYE